MTQSGSPADGEDGRLAPCKNHLIGVLDSRIFYRSDMGGSEGAK